MRGDTRRALTFAELNLKRIKRLFPLPANLDTLKRRNPTAFYRHMTLQVLMHAFGGDAVEAGANLKFIYPRWNPKEWSEDKYYAEAVLDRCKELITEIEAGE